MFDMKTLNRLKMVDEYCIELHNKVAREAGASDAQLTKAGLVAAVIRAGGAATRCAHLFKD